MHVNIHFALYSTEFSGLQVDIQLNDIWMLKILATVFTLYSACSLYIDYDYNNDYTVHVAIMTVHVHWRRMAGAE